MQSQELTHTRLVHCLLSKGPRGLNIHRASCQLRRGRAHRTGQARRWPTNLSTGTGRQAGDSGTCAPIPPRGNSTRRSLSWPETGSVPSQAPTCVLPCSRLRARQTDTHGPVGLTRQGPGSGRRRTEPCAGRLLRRQSDSAASKPPGCARGPDVVSQGEDACGVNRRSGREGDRAALLCPGLPPGPSLRDLFLP